jgi:hypothetical protein
MAGLEQVERHGAAHIAEADETDGRHLRNVSLKSSILCDRVDLV